MTSWARAVIGCAVALLVPSALVACGDDDDGGGAATTAAAGALPPIIVDINSLEGATVDVPAGGTIDLTGDESTFTDWTANIADSSVLSFSPGRVEGGAQFNPGLMARAAGTSEVTLTNSTSGETVTFTVNVTGA